MTIDGPAPVIVVMLASALGWYAVCAGVSWALLGWSHGGRPVFALTPAARVFAALVAGAVLAVVAVVAMLYALTHCTAPNCF